MFVTQPLRRQSPLSDNDVEWMRSRVRAGTLLVSKGTLVALVASTTPAGGGRKGSIADAYVRSDKGLWDGEPASLVAACERFKPDFFDGHRSTLNAIRKKALVGRVMNSVFHDGQAKHGKENLRT